MALEKFEEFSSKVNENYYYGDKSADVLNSYIVWGNSKGQYEEAIKKGALLNKEIALEKPAPGLDQIIDFCESELEKIQEQTLDRTR